MGKKVGGVKSFLSFYFTGIWTLLLWCFTIFVATIIILNVDLKYERCLWNSGYYDLSYPDDDESLSALFEFWHLQDIIKEACQTRKAIRIFIAVVILLMTFLLITIYKSLDRIWQIRKMKKADDDKTGFCAFGLTFCCLPFAYLSVRRELYLIKNERRHQVLTV